MKFARKIKLEVDAETQRILDGQSKICNWLYNTLLEIANGLRLQYVAQPDPQLALTLYTQRGLRNLVPDLKLEHPFLKTVHSSPLKNAALRLARAIGDYQDSLHGRRKGPKMAWPHFRAWGKSWFSLQYDEPHKGWKLDGLDLTLALGQDRPHHHLQVRMRLTQPLPPGCTVQALRIVKEVGHFYAVFAVEKDAPQAKATPNGVNIIALDPNHKNFVWGVDTNGNSIEFANLPNLRHLDARIDYLKSRRDRCQRKAKKVVRSDGRVIWLPSIEWLHFDRLLKQVYRQRREQTKTFLNTLANGLYKTYDVVAVGNYTPHGGGLNKGMRRSMNNFSLIGRFKEVLQWQAPKSGRQFIEYDEFRTTLTCHYCGYRVPGGIEPDIRAWTCPNCGANHLHDENAAQNGLAKAVAEHNLVPRSGLRVGHRYDVGTRWGCWVSPRGIRLTPLGCDSP